MELTLTKCTIREWRPGDEESLVLHANNRNVSRNLRDAFPYPYTLADAEHWIATAGPEDPLTSFAIEVEGSAVGGIGIVLKDDIYRRAAEIGYWLGEEFWGRGIVTEALGVMTDYAFSTWDLCRISAGVFESNAGSVRVLEKAGYQFEGRMRKAVTKDGESIDELIFAIVRR